jgi:hypothetical protein
VESNIQSHFMVLERDEREVKPWVAVEEEDQGQEHLTGRVTGSGGRGHLPVLELLGLIQVKLRVQAPPLLVVLVDALATDRQLDISNGTLGDPVKIGGGSVVGRRGRQTRVASLGVISRYISPMRSPLRATVTDRRAESAAVPFTTCSMFSIAKLVWRLYTA